MSDEIYYMLKKLSIKDKTQKDEWISKYNISTEQALCLKFLNKKSSVIQREIQEYFKVSRASTSSLLKKMESKGLIERKDSNNDKREKIVTMTKKGVDLYNSITYKLPTIQNDIEESLTVQEQKQMTALLQKIDKVNEKE